MKRVLKIIAVGVCLGLILLFVQNGLHIDEDAFMHGYWIAAPIIVLCAVLANMFYNISYQQKMRRLALLLNAGKVNEYIDGVEELLKTAKGQGLRNILELNLAVGYINTNRFDAAIDVLEALPEKSFRGAAIKMIYRLNLCISYFSSGQQEKAAALYNDSRALFDRYRNNRIYGGNIAALDRLAAEKGMRA